MFKSIRCGSHKPTPYLKNNINKLDIKKSALIVDLGCGNCRNTNYLLEKGFTNIYPFDKSNDALNKIDLGKEHIPLDIKNSDLVLCNYVLCFLNAKERRHMVHEISRITRSGSYLMVEMFKAKSAKPYNIDKIRLLFKKWETVHQSKDRFILKRK